jgi:hypothetical protein
MRAVILCFYNKRLSESQLNKIKKIQWALAGLPIADRLFFMQLTKICAPAVKSGWYLKVFSNTPSREFLALRSNLGGEFFFSPFVAGKKA